MWCCGDQVSFGQDSVHADVHFFAVESGKIRVRLKAHGSDSGKSGSESEGLARWLNPQIQGA